MRLAGGTSHTAVAAAFITAFGRRNRRAGALLTPALLTPALLTPALLTPPVTLAYSRIRLRACTGPPTSWAAISPEWVAEPIAALAVSALVALLVGMTRSRRRS